MQRPMLPPVFFIFFFFVFFFPAIVLAGDIYGDGGRDIEYWCSTTPHPEPCRYYLRGRGRSPKDKEEFYRLSLRVAFDLSLHARRHLRQRGPACSRSARARTAWLDCWKLYDNTVFQLNRTFADAASRRGGSASAFDSQTWLSAALTNLGTCLKGFNDTGASVAVIAPVTRCNVSELISNCLAINRYAASTAARNASAGAAAPDHPPTWTTLSDTGSGRRRLLQSDPQANLVVAQDGSGNFRTIREALDAAASSQNRASSSFVIYVKAGVYNEILQVVSSLSNLVMIGDGIGRTIVTGSRSVANGYTTLSSATFSVFGDGFIARGITFRNTYGPGSQAVALMSASDRSAFYRCSIEGYQDTLFVYSQRQFYRECNISGTIDFIFGNAAAVLQRCNIHARLPRHGESDVITAQGRSDQNQNTGIVIQRSTIRAADDLAQDRSGVRSYLGRPWMQYSRTVYMQNYIAGLIDPAGWLPFNGAFALDTLYYAEFRNTGPGSRMSGRVRWAGYHVIGRSSVVRPFTVSRFIAGRTWIPATGVPYDPRFY